MKGRLRPLLLDTLLFLLSVAAALAVAECSLPLVKNRSLDEAVYQARRPVIQAQYGAFHPVLGFTLQNNLRGVRQFYPGQLDYTVDTNSQGFRGPEWDLSPRRKNVLILGDSFAFGWGVAWGETMGQVLERELRKSDPAWQVINLAMPGWSIREVVAALELYRDVLKPVAVIYVFCPNDIDGMTPPLPDGTYDLSYHPPPGAGKIFADLVRRNQPEYRSLKKWLYRSYLKAFHARFIRPLLSRRIRTSMRVDAPPAGFDFPPPLETADTPDGPETRFLRYGLQRLRTAAGGAELILTTTSDKSIVYKADRPENLRWVLKDFSLKTPGARFVDFEEFVRRSPDGRKFYLDFDDHWSSAGHAAAAGMILPALRSESR
ncbi:MAG: SGNH/GDSL hydrolase family protein [Syntrophaceae bacterium]|nr:SGNH/GDSL hydrolase family protein [Syntrophaceae bacterium]